MASPRIEVLLDNTAMTPVVSAALARIGAEIAIAELDHPAATRHVPRFDARLVLTESAESVTNGRLRALLARFDRDPCATLVVSNTDVADDTAHRAVHGRAIGFATAESGDALAGRLDAMCGFRGAMEGLHREIDALRRREAALAARVAQLDEQMRVAGRMQRDFMPGRMPSVRGLEVHVLFRPAEAVSGDVYAFERVDATHVAFAVADATGHGMPAAMLSAYFHRLLRHGAGSRDGAAPPEPDDVLTRLNRAVLEVGLGDCAFLAVVYAVYDETNGTIRWARGGIPHPVVVRSGRGPETVMSSGPVVGVVPEAQYEVASLGLAPGDQMYFFTDGMDAVIAADGALHEPCGDNESDTGNTCRDGDSRWLRASAGPSPRDTLARVGHRLDNLPDAPRRRDDVTVVALQRTA
ncbi:MAG: PP2C family protein-serine/threonine phosphatase [Phycisphaerae bacterium]